MPNRIGIIVLILAGPFVLGGAIFFLTYVRQGNAHLGMLFAGFKNFGTALGAYLLMVLFAIGWIIVGVLPGVVLGLALGLATQQPEAGVIAGVIVGGLGYIIMIVWVTLRYAQTFFLLADHPSLGAYGAICRSVEVMRGNKGRLFWLQMAFAGIGLLCLIVICVGWAFAIIFVMPFFAVCSAIFYDDLYPPPSLATETPAVPAGEPETPILPTEAPGLPSEPGQTPPAAP